MTCGSCGGSSELVGVAGKSLVVSYNVKDVTKLHLLRIEFGEDIIYVRRSPPGYSTLNVTHEKSKDSRLIVSTESRPVKPGPVVVNVTLNQLSLSDIGSVFKYKVITTDLLEGTGENVVSIKGNR